MNIIKNLFLSVLALLSFSATSTSQTSHLHYSHPHATLLDDGAQGTVIEFTFAAPDFHTVEGGLVIPRVGDDHPIMHKGAPDLSKSSATILIDANSHTGVEILDMSYSDYTDIDIAPSKGNLFRNVEPADVPLTFGPQYDADEFFPGQIASLQTPFVQSGVRGQAVWAYPMQYNPVQRVLRVYHSIKLRVIETDGTPVNPATSVARITPELNDAFSRRFINSASVETRYDYIPEHGKLIVVTDPMYNEAIAPLVQWKIEKGITTEVLYASDFAGYNGIKDFLADEYNNNGLTHVILAGDEDQVPSTMVSNSGGDGYCDPCYSYVDGNDHYPEFFVGRLLTHTVSEMNSVVSRTLEYEKSPNMDEDWFNDAVGIGSSEGTGNGDEGQSDWVHQNAIKDLLLGYGYDKVWEVYEGSQAGNSVSTDETADEAGNPNANDMITIVNKGNTVINYCGHGYHEGVATSGFDVDAVEQLENTGMYPFFMAVACCVGDFDEGEGSGDCFGEVWSKATNAQGQAIGGIGGCFSSVLQSWAPPMEAQDEMNNLIVELGAVDIHHTTGSIVAHGCGSMNDAYGTGGDEMTDTWCIFGDPSVVLRTATPTALSLVHQDVYFLGTASIQVNCNVEGALVAITEGSEILGTAFVTGGVADITLNAPLSNPTDILFTGTAYNYLPYQANAQVVPAEGPYVVSNYQFTDDSAGDMDGLVDQGEHIELDINIENVGISTANNVQVTVTSDDPWITVTDGNLLAGNVTAGENLLIEGFEFDVITGVEDGHIAVFFVEITDSDGNIWNTQFSLTLNAPQLEILGLTVNDGGNGILESGENVDLIIEYANVGHDDAVDLQTLVSINHPDVIVNNASFAAGTLAPGESAMATFNVDIASDAGNGVLVSIPTEGDAGAYSTSDEFFEIINLIIENWESGDTESFNWEVSGNQPWFVTTDTPYQGDNCLESGNINDNQSTTLTIELNILAEGTVSFARKVDSEGNYDFLYFRVDGQDYAEWSGDLAWEVFEYTVPAGLHTLEWTYDKDYIVSDGADAAWVDDIVLPPFCFINAYITSSTGNNVLCSGESVTLSIAGDYDITWNNGEIGSSIVVDEEGTYSADLNNGSCEGSVEPYEVVVIEPSNPTINVIGQLAMCGEGEVSLSVLQDGDYIWSNGDTGSSITTDQDGEYSVSMTDACGYTSTSATYVIEHYTAPDAPSVSDISLPEAGDATFTGASSTTQWFLNEDDTTPAGTGSSFTQFVSETTNFWVEDAESHAGTNAGGGQIDNNSIGQYHNNNTRWLMFDAYQAFTLETVKVYANGAGNRTIALVDSEGNELTSTTVFIGNGEQEVSLGFDIPVGSDFGLKCNDANPQLWRDGNGSNPDFPYALGSMGAITKTSIPLTNALNFYFFFYNWQISSDATVCTSNRVPVTVDVANSIGEIDGISNINVFPVPANDILNIEFEAVGVTDLQISIHDSRGRVVHSTNYSEVGSEMQQIDISSMRAGIYTLAITDGATKVISRVVIR
jgi:hypothetical protein